jgi:hypothetical protein
MEDAREDRFKQELKSLGNVKEPQPEKQKD